MLSGTSRDLARGIHFHVEKLQGEFDARLGGHLGGDLGAASDDREALAHPAFLADLVQLPPVGAVHVAVADDSAGQDGLGRNFGGEF